MKILVLSWWRRNYMSNRQHLATLDKMDQYCDIDIYGREELLEFEGVLESKFLELYEKHQPDVVICYAAMHFVDIGPLFRDIKGCLKICIEPDYHNIIKWDNIPEKVLWYKQNNFDFIMYRNADDTEVDIPHVWWPWSANPYEFYPDEGVERKNIIGFVGSSNHPLYDIRRKAIKILEISHLLDNKGKDIVRSEMKDGIWTNSGAYPKYLKSIAGLLVSTENRGPFAKTFEGMASMTPILSSPIYNKDILFGGKNCYIEYKYDLSDLIDQGRRIIHEPDWAKRIAENAYEQFMDKHTQRKRIEELYNHINNLLTGKEVEKKWGI